MDILAARKKAAELAKAKSKTGQEQVVPNEPVVVQQAPKTEEQAVTPLPIAEPAPVSDAPIAAEPAAEKNAESVDSAPGEAHAREVEMLSFRLGKEEYTVMVDDVKEVLKNRELTPVPNSPDYILGVTALRGPVLPVVDLCKRLGIPPGVRDEKSRILVLNLDDEDMGIVVDRVTGVVRIEQDAVRPVPDTIEHGAEFLRGIARKDEKLYILLDIEKALGA